MSVRHKNDSTEDDTKRTLMRVKKKLHDFITDNTEAGLVVTRNEAGVPQSATLPRAGDGSEMDLTALRPVDTLRSPEVTRDSTVTNPPNNDNTYMLLHRTKMCDFWNEAFQAHIKFCRECTGKLVLNDELCKKWGLVWEIAANCTKCNFKSDPKKIYEEISTGQCGRKSADVNIGLQVGLSKQGISNTGIRQVLAAANVIPPASSNMQKASNKVTKLIQQCNEQDMTRKCDELKHLNVTIGRPASDPIPAEADGTYNNKIYSGIGKTPFQAGTQSTFLVAENLTKEKKIISTKTYSKLCSCIRPRKETPHRTDCTANLDKAATIGNEGLYLTEAVRSINETGLQIGNLTMDGDSSSRHTASQISQPGGSTINPQYCTRHLSRTMQNRCKKTTFSASMFPGHNKLQRNQLQNRFAYDLSDRIQAEFNCAIKDLGKDTSKLESKLADITDAIIDCYRGSCQRCDEHSYVCLPELRRNRKYFDFNPDLKKRRELLKPSSEDISKLREIIAIRLGPGAIHKTVHNTTQNKCEASNRGVKKSVPGHITYRRNYSGRVHSAVHSINNGVGTSTIDLCQAAGATIDPNSSVSRALESMDKIKHYQQSYKKTHQHKERRRTLVQENFRMHDEKKEKETGYSRYGALEDVLPNYYYTPAPVPVRHMSTSTTTIRLARALSSS